MQPGDKAAFPSTTQIGDECYRLLLAERDDELALRLTSEYADYGGASLMPLLRRRISHVRPLPAPSTAMVEARTAGYELLSTHTGAVDEIADVWPQEHRMDRVQVGDLVTDGDDNAERWMVRSPWPSATVGEVVHVLIDEMERDSSLELQDRWSRAAARIFGRTTLRPNEGHDDRT